MPPACVQSQSAILVFTGAAAMMRSRWLERPPVGTRERSCRSSAGHPSLLDWHHGRRGSDRMKLGISDLGRTSNDTTPPTTTTICQHQQAIHSPFAATPKWVRTGYVAVDSGEGVHQRVSRLDHAKGGVKRFLQRPRPRYRNPGALTGNRRGRVFHDAPSPISNL